MKHILLMTCRFLGFKRRKPKTKLGQSLRWCEYSLSIVGILYFLLLTFPHPLFAYSYEHEGIKIYSTDPIPENIQNILTSIRSRIKGSTLHQEKDTFRVFLCNTENLYTLLSAFHRHSFAVSYPVIDNIVVSYGDLELDLCRAYKSLYNERSLKSVISHEMGHALMRRRLGFWKELRLPTWLKEGYCEMLSGDSSFPIEKGKQLMITGQTNPSVSFRYYTYRQMVDYLINETEQSIGQLAATPPSEKVVMKEAVNWLSMKSIEPAN